MKVLTATVCGLSLVTESWILKKDNLISERIQTFFMAWLIALQARGKTWIIDLGLNCPFKQWPISIVPTFLACSAEVSHLVLKWLKAARFFLCNQYLFFVFFIPSRVSHTTKLPAESTVNWSQPLVWMVKSLKASLRWPPHIWIGKHTSPLTIGGVLFEKRLVICSKFSSLDLFLSSGVRRSPERGL